TDARTACWMVKEFFGPGNLATPRGKESRLGGFITSTYTVHTALGPGWPAAKGRLCLFRDRDRSPKSKQELEFDAISAAEPRTARPRLSRSSRTACLDRI